jgi:ubiquinone/menaquinone biosynthesis C-methylase UbiE
MVLETKGKMVPSRLSEEEEVARIQAEFRRRDRDIPAQTYSWTRPVNQFFRYQLYRACANAFLEHRIGSLDELRLLDVGCGSGSWLLDFAQWGAQPVNLAGIELEEGRFNKAKDRLPAADLRCGDARHLPWPDGTFDIVTQFTVFSSILDAGVRQRIAGQMLRVTRPHGLIFWYDFRFNNPRNQNVRCIKEWEIRSLFPGCRIELRKLTLAPPLARFIVPVRGRLG